MAKLFNISVEGIKNIVPVTNRNYLLLRVFEQKNRQEAIKMPWRILILSI